MKIAYLYDRCYIGGIEYAIRNRMHHLKEMGCDSSITFMRSGLEDNIFKRCEHYVTQNQYMLNKILMSCDVVDILSADEYVFKKAYKIDKPVIHECHNSLCCDYLTQLSREKIRAVIFPSNANKVLNKHFLDSCIPSYTVYNFLDKDFVQKPKPVRKPLRKIILWIGRFERTKNWLFLIKLAKMLDDSYLIKLVINFELSLDYHDFMNAVKAEGLSGRIQVIPNCSNEEMPYYYAEAKYSGCYLSTSISESFGMTALEAIYSGCPSVLSDLPSFREISGDCAVYYPVNDAGRCISLIDALCSDRSLRQDMKIRMEKRSGIFNPDEICKEFLKIVDETCFQRGK